MVSVDSKEQKKLNKIETRANIISDLITDIPIPESDDPDTFDSYCDPDHPVAITYCDVAAANYRIRDGIVRTPCKKSSLSKQLNMKIYLKLEFQQVTGSFKERGARNVLLQLTEEQARRGVVASSAGNHAQALAYHGKELGIPVTVVMPKNAPLMKVENCIGHGANVLLKGVDMSQAKPYAVKLSKINDLLYVNGYDHPQILAGQGTVALEIMEQVPHVDAILVPVGGGGLLAGIAVAVKGINPHVQVIGVESDCCAAFGASMAAGKLVHTPCQPTVADGLAVPVVGCNSLHTCMGLVDKMISVDEAYIHRAIVRLLEVEKCVVEGGGATALAALMAGLLPELEGKTVVPLLTGGNIDTTVLGRVIERGLAFEGRMCRFMVIVSDRPGGIAELCSVLRDLGVRLLDVKDERGFPIVLLYPAPRATNEFNNVLTFIEPYDGTSQGCIKDIFHERAWLISSIFSVQVKCVCETRDADHAALLERTLRQKYEHVLWGPAAL